MPPDSSATTACHRFIYSAFLTLITLLCPAVIIWLDPWKWELWHPPMLFLVSTERRAVEKGKQGGPDKHRCQCHGSTENAMVPPMHCALHLPDSPLSVH